MIKKIAYTFLFLFISLSVFVWWFISLLGDELSLDYSQQNPNQLEYLTNTVKEKRGKILTIVTSTNTMESNKKTGYELTELSRAYYVFTANGFDVDIASPQGGIASMVRDDDDMGAYDYAFLNDSKAMSKARNTLAIYDVNLNDYVGVYFVGGKGTMFDFPNNQSIQEIVRHFSESGKTISAVCHGPAALVNVKLENGKYFVANKNIASFTNKEELFLIPNAEKVFPFLLQTKLTEQGAHFIEGESYLNNVVVDGKLITGQNPWSVWELAEATIKALGYEPKPRQPTAEENSVRVLNTYAKKGYSVAKSQLLEISTVLKQKFSRTTIATHAFVALISFEFERTVHLLALLSSLN